MPILNRTAVQPKRVYIHWTTDNWRSTQVTPCFFYRMHWDKWRRGSARNPNRYDTSIWISQIKPDDAFRIQYAIGCDTPSRTIWDNNFGHNYVARRRRLKILTLNLHCYQEENQDAKFSQIALEYNSMYLGFQALYLMAMVCYALAFVSQWIFVDKDAAGTATPGRVP